MFGSDFLMSSDAVYSIPRMRKDCLFRGKRNLVKLSNHLANIHQLSAVERKDYLCGTKYPAKPKDMSSRSKH